MAAKGLNKRFGQSLDAEIMQLSFKKNSGNTKKSCIITGLIHLTKVKFVTRSTMEGLCKHVNQGQICNHVIHIKRCPFLIYLIFIVIGCQLIGGNIYGNCVDISN
jgi:hypothetical protein